MDVPTDRVDLWTFYAVVTVLSFILVRFASGLLHSTKVPALGFAHILVAGVSVVVAAQIFTGDGTARYGLAALVCVPPVIVWFLLDCVIAVRMRAVEREKAERDLEE
ncbi:MAG: hypothetical protein AAF563_17355 [Pseudomonadota bacterium]